MLFDLDDNDIDDDLKKSEGSIGAKIRRYREARGLTQKEVGLRCGFSYSSSDVRIGQYETNKRAARLKVLRDICEALEINEGALMDGDMFYINNMYHALFDIEDFHGLHPIKKGDTYYLAFSGNTIDGHTVSRQEYVSFLKDWYEMREKCSPLHTDTPEQIEEKLKTYTLWRAEYPNNVIQEAKDRRDDIRRMSILQAELDELNARVKSDDELAKIDAALERVLPEVKETYIPITMESELIYIVKEMITGRINVEKYSPSDLFSSKSQFWHVLSIRTNELLEDENKMKIFARFVCAVETIQAYGIQIERCITSRKDELFITYRCPDSQYIYFKNLYEVWDQMLDVITGKGVLNEIGRQFVEKEFKSQITGENDVCFQIE